MACFLVPMTEAIATSVVQKIVEKKEGKIVEEKGERKELRWSQRLSWLNKLLWGGVTLLAIEHIWHGEVSPIPPFLTAMKTPEEIPVMLQEIRTVGGAMTIVVTLVWVLMVIIAELIRNAKPVIEEKKVGAEGM